MVFGRKKDRELTEEAEKREEQLKKERHTLIRKRKTPYMDIGWTMIGYLLIVPLLVWTGFFESVTPLEPLMRLVVVMLYGFGLVIGMSLMHFKGMDERNTFQYYGMYEFENDAVTNDVVWEVKEWEQLNPSQYSTNEAFDAELAKLTGNGKNGKKGLKGIAYQAHCSNPDEDRVLITPGVELTECLQLHPSEVDTRWSTGTGKLAANSYIQPLLEPIKMADGRLISAFFLIFSEKLARKFGKPLDLVAKLTDQELVRLHSQLKQKDAKYWKNVAVANEKRLKDVEEALQKTQQGIWGAGELVSGTIIGSHKLATGKGLPGGRDYGEMLFGTKLKKAAWGILAGVLIGIAVYFWVFKIFLGW